MGIKYKSYKGIKQYDLVPFVFSTCIPPQPQVYSLNNRSMCYLNMLEQTLKKIENLNLLTTKKSSKMLKTFVLGNIEKKQIVMRSLMGKLENNTKHL